ncbi:hypothetical protein [Streptomyces sp. NBC_00474]|uniref:hypothetical protein n=1 Tax=Streptomyces sp. NBC_00474 TaxID=2975754 RepID=UPI00224EC166|nr:hypothetical protein [Streptomyces sp. NBC_00474]MCX5048355.1 hypothetical protein [Streptomyces sp. NBC_00474]
MDSGAIRRRLATLLTVLAASGLLAVAAPGQAQAAAQSCSGHKIRTLAFSTGSVKLYRSGNYLCALTVPKGAAAKRPMMVSMQVRGFEPIVDKGQFTSHAGPVRAYVGHRKVWIKGSVGRGSYDSGGWKRY